MKLFAHPASPNCVAVAATANWLGLRLEVKQVDLFGGEQSTPAFLALNPNGKAPVLRHGDFVLWETTAILQYFVDCSPRASFGWTARERADVARWLAWGLAHWNPSLQPFIFQRVFKPMKGLGEPDEALLADRAAELRRTASVLDQRLASSEHVCGEGVSAADFFLAAYPMYAREARLELAEFDCLRRWLERIHHLPQWREAQENLAAA